MKGQRVKVQGRNNTLWRETEGERIREKGRGRGRVRGRVRQGERER
jgi:hypothetical protein